jgi:ribonuclease HII
MPFRICGLDEAGRGALAGPLVAAGVVLAVPGETVSRQCGVPLRDSKLLSKRQRETMFAALTASGALVVTATISATRINQRDIGWANRHVFIRLIGTVDADSYIVDGNLKIDVPSKHGKIRSLVDADATVPEVIMAGIAAKVTRDRIMAILSRRYPLYGWDRNAGYGTREHIGAIIAGTTTPYHRTIFVTTALDHAGITSSRIARNASV